jgi:hypothetical protein
MSFCLIFYYKSPNGFNFTNKSLLTVRCSNIVDKIWNYFMHSGLSKMYKNHLMTWYSLISYMWDYPMISVRMPQASHNLLSRFVCWRWGGKNLNVTHPVTSSIMWVLFRFYSLEHEKIYFYRYIIGLSYLEDHGASADSAGVNVEYCPVLTSVHDDTNLYWHTILPCPKRLIS